MTVTEVVPISGPYTGNDVLDTFDYTFFITDETELVITLADVDGVETVQTLTTHYTVVRNAETGKGTFVMLTPPATDEQVTATLDIPIDQTTDLRNKGPFFAETHEAFFDKAIRIMQQLKEAIDRSLRVGVTSGADPEDVDLSLYALLASPTFSGIPNAPTAAPGEDSTQIATTAFVAAAAALLATIASPTLTGVPAAPTAAPGTDSTQLATTAFVAAMAALLAPIASPTLTGVPAAPTAAADTDTTQIATTAFVGTAIAASGGPLLIDSVGEQAVEAELVLGDYDVAIPTGYSYLYVQVEALCPTISASDLMMQVGASGQWWTTGQYRTMSHALKAWSVAPQDVSYSNFNGTSALIASSVSDNDYTNFSMQLWFPILRYSLQTTRWSGTILYGHGVDPGYLVSVNHGGYFYPLPCQTLNSVKFFWSAGNFSHRYASLWALPQGYTI